MSRLTAFLLLMLLTVHAQAQGDVEYRMEIGATAGAVAYEGDFNGNPLRDMQPMGGVVLRRLFNPWTGLRLSAAYGQLKGSSANVKTYYPDYAAAPYEFSNAMADVSLTFECNLLPYGTGRDYRGAKRLVPFVFAGLGGTYAKTSRKSVFTGNMPVGLGIKYKVADRLNLGVEWGIHFSLSDELDGVRDPYYVESSGLFKNTDCYSALLLSLTYSFMPKCRTCHNADE